MYEANNSEALTLFSVDEKSGEVSLAKSAHGRENEVYQFFVRVKDEGTPSLRSDVPVSIFLLPPQELAPKCPVKYARFFLKEGADIGTVVTSLWVEGPLKVTYKLLNDQQDEALDGSDDSSDDDDDTFSKSMSNNGPFTVTPTGLVVVNAKLDHEKKRAHDITVLNQTLTTPPAMDYMTISVVVMDANDCPPKFSSDFYEVVVAENSNAGSTIYVLSATDDDDGNNGQIQYSLSKDSSDTIRSIFSIDPHTGEVTILSQLDRELQSEYTFTVVAKDGGSNPLSAEAKLHVVVKDYNDNPPIFTKEVYVTAGKFYSIHPFF